MISRITDLLKDLPNLISEKVSCLGQTSFILENCLNVSVYECLLHLLVWMLDWKFERIKETYFPIRPF
ncbi:hypothetical protein NPIL_458841 [Nephila pilipes]|uniref:Uncharacterized protein n=1 Tax=Nephila pilipes TaxID=299642 RepID=A0A8X6KMK4_NEPPI|nr:hypothetical protein NPIL_458841 [Nephila pilipes]